MSKEKMMKPLLVAMLTLVTGLGIAGCSSSDGDGANGTGEEAVSEAQEQSRAELEQRLEEVQKRVDRKIEQLRESAGRPDN